MTTPSPYNARWRRRRREQLTRHPLCAMCQLEGRITAATVADHIEPHRGDPVKFEGPIQSLCKFHHDAHKQRLEKRNVTDFGSFADGWPRDPGHLWNQPANQPGNKQPGKQQWGALAAPESDSPGS